MTLRKAHWALALVSILYTASATASPEAPALRFIQVAAKTKEERSAIANRGVSIEAVRSDSVWGIAHDGAIRKLREAAIPILGDFPIEIARGGHETGFGQFPPGDSRFHTYSQTLQALKLLASQHVDIARLASIGKSGEGRDLWALHINTTPDSLLSGTSSKAGAIFMGTHHAREHVSNEMPLMLAQYLLEHRDDAAISALLESRDIWIIPMVNPDGAEFDIATGRYQYWRKNRRNNGDGTYGVDLNRNYGFQWGTGGSDTDTSSEVYMGPKPFSEPETQVIRDFVEAHLNAKVLLTFHTYSELVLYPWGHKYDAIDNAKDHAVFDKMARTMAGWNHYTPEQASQLYIASGDTTDWAYGAHGIFAFTFELSPGDSAGSAGFYPGAGILDKVFADNLKPCLYLLDLADDPYRSVTTQPSGWLKSYVEPRVPEEYFF